ncbi:hypothetical protein MMC11_002353 [Xylographa trunciseda]|nr:hypothetical protein [Xylographa trunciseda]
MYPRDPYRGPAPVANMVEEPYRAPTAHMYPRDPYRGPAPVANMVEEPYRAPTAHMYPYEPFDRIQPSAEASYPSTGYRAPTANMTETYRGREHLAAPIAPMYPGAGGLAPGYRSSERHRDGYSNRERPCSRGAEASAAWRDPSEGSHSYERSGDRYGDRYRDGGAEPYSRYRG